MGFDHHTAEAPKVAGPIQRLGKRVEWDAKSLRSPNCPEADKYVNKVYRDGWEV